MTEGMKLKVAEAIQDDVNKGIVRIDSTLMREANLKRGDVVEIVGEKTTVAIVERAYPGDIGLNIIRMDGLLRRNAKTGIGELVDVKPAEVKYAKKIVLAPARKDIVVKADPLFFKKGLIGRAVVKGDLISLGGRSRRRTSYSGSPFFDDIVEMLDEGVGFGFSDLKFIVVDTNPKEPVKISEDTEIEYNPDAELTVEQTTVPDVTYEDIGGLQEEIKKIREMVELPIMHPEVFDRLGIEPPKGVLLHGSPGTGKTLLAKAVANETKSHFIVINGPEIMSKFYGQSEENLRKKFEEAEANAPAIVFIDEIDAIASKREEAHGDVEKRVVAQLLSVMDGLQARGKVVVIAATNIPNSIDPALRRPGRFDREIEIGVPKEKDRLEVLKVHTRNMPLSPPFDPAIANDTIKEYEDKLDKDVSQAEKEIKNLKKELDKKEDARVKEKLKDRIDQKDKEKAKAQESLKDLHDKKPRIEKEIGSTDPERGLFGLTYVDLKLLADKTIYLLVDKINKRLNKAELNQIENIDELSSIKDLKEKLLTDSDVDEQRKKIVEEVLAEINLDIDNFHFSVSGLKQILSYIEDEQLKSYLDKLIKESKSDEELNEAISASWLNHELKEKIRQNLVDEMLKWVAKITHGFVGADLASLSKESAMIVLRRLTSGFKEKEGDIAKYVEKLNISVDDIKEALKSVRPSALREVLVEVPNVTWNHVGGLTDVKQELSEAVEWPLKHPQSFNRLGVKAPKGILLYGPPGTGKTLLAKAVAKESESNFILVKGPEVLSKWVGESEKAIREIFKKARQTSPTIIFLDEIDSIVPSRSVSSDSKVSERVVNQILTEMDGLEELLDVVIIGATNRPDMIDTALLRPGRFDRILLVPAPDKKTREEIFRVHTKSMPLDKGVKITDLASKTDGYAGADIEAICREAAIYALREDINVAKVSMKHFEKALKRVMPSVTKDIVESYENMKGYFTSAKARQMASEKPAYFG